MYFPCLNLSVVVCPGRSIWVGLKGNRSYGSVADVVLLLGVPVPV